MIVGRIRQIERRNKTCAGKQGREKIRIADVCFSGDENIGMKNNIFIFHRLLLILCNRVKLPGQDQRDRSGGRRISEEVDRDHAPSFFDIDKFQLVVPVERHLREIKRDGAEVGIVGKVRIPM